METIVEQSGIPHTHHFKNVGLLAPCPVQCLACSWFTSLRFKFGAHDLADAPGVVIIAKQCCHAVSATFLLAS